MISILRLFYLNFWMILQLCRAKGEVNWDYELLDMNVDNNDRNDIDVNIEFKRLSREEVSINGYIEIKENLYDDMCLSVDVYRSTQGNEDSYTRTPFFIPKTHLTEAMNTLIPKFVLPTVQNCSKNFPDYNGKDKIFTPPLTPRIMEFDSCTIQLDGAPNEISTGFYRLIFTWAGNDGSVVCSSLVRIQNNN